MAARPSSVRRKHSHCVGVAPTARHQVEFGASRLVTAAMASSPCPAATRSKTRSNPGGAYPSPLWPYSRRILCVRAMRFLRVTDTSMRAHWSRTSKVSAGRVRRSRFASFASGSRTGSDFSRTTASRRLGGSASSLRSEGRRVGHEEVASPHAARSAGPQSAAHAGRVGARRSKRMLGFWRSRYSFARFRTNPHRS